MRKRINSFEGVRIIVCLCVFFRHFKDSFFPEQIWKYVEYTPFKILVTGNTLIRILLTLSGIVVSYKYFTAKRYDDVPKDIVKRYFRLAPPVIAANILVYLMMRMGLLFHERAALVSGSEQFLGIFNTFEPNFFLCMKEALFTCYLKGAHEYVGPFWTMVYEYLGVILVLSAMYICREKYLMRYLFYIVTFMAFSSYYNYLVLGMLICDIYTQGNVNERLKRHKWIHNIMFIIGLCAVCMIDVDDGIKLTRVALAVGLMMMFLGLLNASWAERVLGNQVMQAGGKLSYGIYIVHWPLIESVGSAYYLWVMETGVHPYIGVGSCLCLLLVCIFIVAYLFCNYVEKTGEIFIKRIDYILERTR